jgi:DNA-directed RNA polymerase subunit alpha
MRIRWRGLELPNRVTLEPDTATDTYGRFIAEPFERGFGATVGNSLRRVLISSLEGSAVTRVKIQGVQHEFSTIPGVVEDVTDIVLNIKALVVKNHSDQPRTMTIDRHERGVVTAADLKTDDQVEVVNKGHILATLTDDVPFVAELTVENGRGYISADENEEREQEIGIIPVDAIYSPVLRVRYQTEDTRVGQRTNYDKLIMEIWTNGTVTPEMALVEAAKILRKHLNPFIQYRELRDEVRGDMAAKRLPSEGPVDIELDEKLNMSLAELNLSVRATNCLETENINTVRDLVSRSEEELLQVRNFGETTLHEVTQRLADIGLKLGMHLPESSSV